MAKDNKIHLPSSGGGLVRYYDDYKSKIELSPYFVIGLIVIVTIIGIVLHKMS